MKTVNIDDLQEGMISNQTICDNRGIILVAIGIPLTRSIIARLRKFNIQCMTIQEAGETPAPPETYTSITEKTLRDMKEIAAAIFNDRTLKIKNNIGKIEAVMAEALKKPYVQTILETMVRDKKLFQHSLRTAILSTNVGLTRGYNDLNLEYLAASVLVHDCGMGDHFQEQDTEHPFAGFVMLRDNPQIEMLTALVCLQHHEFYNGGGFPFSFSRTQITEFASLLSIVDYYDRLLMANVPPRKALFDTIGKKDRLFHPLMAEAFGTTIDWSRMYHLPKQDNPAPE